ncbi:hypothetical protein CYLTODRAFT_450980 [Cylindrobasidium torrendii FP15055 ss-10]|uniref:Folate-sensitive fragile site protein Fra10Ac1 n=1 Tax=Cylindrobasidium torrendii FP15055 ss-10 TaxID=1314674 RepID=A0A0D7BNM8_9AGAR|nr:hypothetical protein CYLTODRAFT_450980 [Cylindrobasidium torrendii FP15055 ss-10]
MSLYPTKKIPSPPRGPSEFELLRASHKFLREETTASKDQTWEDKLAEKYYSSLYREFALCDLKHYKSGNFSLRWRTENEVVSGAGETSCANTRCPQHDVSNVVSALATVELPFSYEEDGEVKSALVKAVLCPKCLDKLMYKRRKDKESAAARSHTESERGEARRRRSASPGPRDDHSSRRRRRHSSPSGHRKEK